MLDSPCRICEGMCYSISASHIFFQYQLFTRTANFLCSA